MSFGFYFTLFSMYHQVILFFHLTVNVKGAGSVFIIQETKGFLLLEARVLKLSSVRS